MYIKYKCKRATVYATGIRGTEIVSARNGNESDSCTEIPGKCGCIHAEINLLKKMPNPIEVVITMSPCLNCAKALVDAGVKKVSYLNDYRLLDGLNYLKDNGVLINKMEGDSL